MSALLVYANIMNRAR